MAKKKDKTPSSTEEKEEQSSTPVSATEPEKTDFEKKDVSSSGEKKPGKLQKFFTDHKLLSIVLILAFLIIGAGLFYYLRSSGPGLSFITKRDDSEVGGSRTKQSSNQGYFSSLFDSEKKDEEEAIIKPPTVEISPSPVPIAHGPETYRVSQANKAAPQIKTASFDPLDPGPEESQLIEVEINHSQAVEKVTVKILTDNKETVKELELASGSAANGTWSTTWDVDDTYFYQYAFIITATSNEEGSVEITVR